MGLSAIKTSDEQVHTRMGNSSRGDYFNFFGYRLILNDIFWTLATGLLPFNFSQGWQASGGLHEPAWQPGVVGQGSGSLRV